MPLFVRIILAVLCVITAIDPLRAAYMLLRHFVWPNLAESEAYLDRFVIYGINLTGAWQIYTATIVLFAAGVALVTCGLYLMTPNKLRNKPPPVPH